MNFKCYSRMQMTIKIIQKASYNTGTPLFIEINGN